jgi:myosin heavy chain IB
MLSDEQKAQIAAAYSDKPEQGTPEAFVDMWGAWWAACLSSNESAESVALYKQDWLCETHEEFHETSGRTSKDHETFTDWQGGTGLLQALIGNYSQGVNSRASSSKVAAATASMNTKAGGGNKDAQNASWAVAGAATSAGVDKNVVEAVSNPSSQIAKFVNQLKKDGVGAISEAIKLMNSAFSFEADADWFRSTYAAAAGVGLLLLAGNFVVGITRAGRGNLPASEAFGRLGASLLLGLAGLLFTPALAYTVSTVVDAAGDGVATLVGASQDSLTGSLLNPTTAMTTDSTPLGWMGTILVFVLCFIAGVMLMLSLAAQLATAYFSAVALGVMWGFATSEKGRERLKRVGAFFLSALIAKPVILFFLWVAMKMSAAYSATVDGWSQNPMETLFRVALSLIAVLMVAVSPAWVAKFIPVAGGASGGFSRGGFLSGGVAGGAVGGAAAFLGDRMRRFSPVRPYRSAGAASGGPGVSAGASAGGEPGPGVLSGGSGRRSPRTGAGFDQGTRAGGSATTSGGSGVSAPGGDQGSGGRLNGDTLRGVARGIGGPAGAGVRGAGAVLGAAGRGVQGASRAVSSPLLDAAAGAADAAERSLS